MGIQGSTILSCLPFSGESLCQLNGEFEFQLGSADWCTFTVTRVDLVVHNFMLIKKISRQFKHAAAQIGRCRSAGIAFRVSMSPCLSEYIVSGIMTLAFEVVILVCYDWNYLLAILTSSDNIRDISWHVKNDMAVYL